MNGRDMKLRALTSGLDLTWISGQNADDFDIADLAIDSRQVSPGSLFAALPGEKLDGRDFIPAALKAGANAILLPAGSGIDCGSAVCLEAGNPRQTIAQMAGRLYAPQPKNMVGVSGTNGKTSVVNFIRQLWQALGEKAASIGTLGVEGDGIRRAGTLTTPDVITFQKILQEVAGAGIRNAVFEASSHGLAQHRMDGADISVAAFTNLSRDHLDYHQTMDAYFEAKARLYLVSLPEGGTAVINIDSAWGVKLAARCRTARRKVILVGRSIDCHVRLVSSIASSTGQSIIIEVAGARIDVELSLIGAFQADNAILALGVMMALGKDVLKVAHQLSGLLGVCGRMELVGTTPGGGMVIVDYAHTPDGLENALNAAREHGGAEIHIVFGCGGDRDSGKRPQMGRIAARLADQVFVTDDNPRCEDPAHIRAEILEAAGPAREFDDRAEAIATAIRGLHTGDILLVTGKGHEPGQEIGGEILPFSDFDVVRKAITALESGGAP
jgi:UDP-N-acetylmuramoyl-L-alanyl-D-glutamate--2,6-diaminopimelate ligase